MHHSLSDAEKAGSRRHQAWTHAQPLQCERSLIVQDLLGSNLNILSRLQVFERPLSFSTREVLAKLLNKATYRQTL